VIASIVAILLGICPKFGSLVDTIPNSIIGGILFPIFGLIAVTGGRIWVENRVDFSQTRNLITAAVALTMGAGNFTITLGNFSLSGIGTATFSAIILYQMLRERTPRAEALATADRDTGIVEKGNSEPNEEA
jgi:putative pyrimidine permease RutG